MKLPCTLSERATNNTKALPPQGWHREVFSITTGCTMDNNPAADFILSLPQSLQFSFGSTAVLYSVLVLTSSAQLPVRTFETKSWIKTINTWHRERDSSSWSLLWLFLCQTDFSASKPQCTLKPTLDSSLTISHIQNPWWNDSKYLFLFCHLLQLLLLE